VEEGKGDSGVAGWMRWLGWRTTSLTLRRGLYVTIRLGATTIADVAYVKAAAEAMGQMGVTVDGDPVLLPVPEAKLRAAVAEMLGEASPGTCTRTGGSEVVVREVVASNTEMPKLPEPTKGRLNAGEVSLFAARLAGALKDTPRCAGLASMVEELRKDPSDNTVLRLRAEATSGEREGVAEATERRVAQSVMREATKHTLEILSESAIANSTLLEVLMSD